MRGVAQFCPHSLKAISYVGAPLLSARAATSAASTNGDPELGKFPRGLRPAQVMLAERKRPDPLAGDLEDRLRHGGGNLRDRFIADPHDPFIVGLEELDADLRGIISHAG